ncbi:MAG: hypothetical protein Fur0024_2560 [Patescibacteria group bacterium]
MTERSMEGTSAFFMEKAREFNEGFSLQLNSLRRKYNPEKCEKLEKQIQQFLKQVKEQDIDNKEDVLRVLLDELEDLQELARNNKNLTSNQGEEKGKTRKEREKKRRKKDREIAENRLRKEKSSVVLLKEGLENVKEIDAKHADKKPAPKNLLSQLEKIINELNQRKKDLTIEEKNRLKYLKLEQTRIKKEDQKIVKKREEENKRGGKKRKTKSRTTSEKEDKSKLAKDTELPEGEKAKLEELLRRMKEYIKYLDEKGNDPAQTVVAIKKLSEAFNRLDEKKVSKMLTPEMRTKVEEMRVKFFEMLVKKFYDYAKKNREGVAQEKTDDKKLDQEIAEHVKFVQDEFKAWEKDFDAKEQQGWFDLGIDKVDEVLGRKVKKDLAIRARKIGTKINILLLALEGSTKPTDKQLKVQLEAVKARFNERKFEKVRTKLAGDVVFGDRRKGDKKGEEGKVGSDKKGEEGKVGSDEKIYWQKNIEKKIKVLKQRKNELVGKIEQFSSATDKDKDKLLDDFLVLFGDISDLIPESGDKKDELEKMLNDLFEAVERRKEFADFLGIDKNLKFKKGKEKDNKDFVKAVKEKSEKLLKEKKEKEKIAEAGEVVKNLGELADRLGDCKNVGAVRGFKKGVVEIYNKLKEMEGSVSDVNKAEVKKVFEALCVVLNKENIKKNLVSTAYTTSGATLRNLGEIVGDFDKEVKRDILRNLNDFRKDSWEKVGGVKGILELTGFYKKIQTPEGETKRVPDFWKLGAVMTAGAVTGIVGSGGVVTALAFSAIFTLAGKGMGYLWNKTKDLSSRNFLGKSMQTTENWFNKSIAEKDWWKYGIAPLGSLALGAVFGEWTGGIPILEGMARSGVGLAGSVLTGDILNRIGYTEWLKKQNSVVRSVGEFIGGGATGFVGATARVGMAHRAEFGNYWGEKYENFKGDIVDAYEKGGAKGAFGAIFGPETAQAGSSASAAESYLNNRGVSDSKIGKLTSSDFAGDKVGLVHDGKVMSFGSESEAVQYAETNNFPENEWSLIDIDPKNGWMVKNPGEDWQPVIDVNNVGHGGTTEQYAEAWKEYQDILKGISGAVGHDVKLTPEQLAGLRGDEYALAVDQKGEVHLILQGYESEAIAKGMMVYDYKGEDFINLTTDEIVVEAPKAESQTGEEGGKGGSNEGSENQTPTSEANATEHKFSITPEHSNFESANYEYLSANDFAEAKNIMDYLGIDTDKISPERFAHLLSNASSNSLDSTRNFDGSLELLDGREIMVIQDNSSSDTPVRFVIIPEGLSGEELKAVQDSWQERIGANHELHFKGFVDVERDALDLKNGSEGFVMRVSQNPNLESAPVTETEAPAPAENAGAGSAGATENQTGLDAKVERLEKAEGGEPTPSVEQPAQPEPEAIHEMNLDKHLEDFRDLAKELAGLTRVDMADGDIERITLGLKEINDLELTPQERAEYPDLAKVVDALKDGKPSEITTDDFYLASKEYLEGKFYDGYEDNVESLEAQKNITELRNLFPEKYYPNSEDSTLNNLSQLEGKVPVEDIREAIEDSRPMLDETGVPTNETTFVSNSFVDTLKSLGNTLGMDMDKLINWIDGKDIFGNHHNTQTFDAQGNPVDFAEVYQDGKGNLEGVRIYFNIEDKVGDGVMKQAGIEFGKDGKVYEVVNGQRTNDLAYFHARVGENGVGLLYFGDKDTEGQVIKVIEKPEVAYVPSSVSEDGRDRDSSSGNIGSNGGGVNDSFGQVPGQNEEGGNPF